MHKEREMRVFGWRLGILRGKSPILRGYHRFWMGLMSPWDINPILSRRIWEFGGAITDFEGKIIDYEGKITDYGRVNHRFWISHPVPADLGFRAGENEKSCTYPRLNPGYQGQRQCNSPTALLRLIMPV